MKKTNNNQNALLIGGGLVALWFLFSSAGRGGGIVSKYYTIDDVQNSQTAIDQNILEQFQNLPPQVIDNVNAFIKYVLDPLTEILGEKLDIESWWRSIGLNTAVGGVDGSFHTFGFAIDADSLKDGVIDNKRLVKAMLQYKIPFTEMILYTSVSKPTQIHLAYNPESPEQGQILLKDSNGYHDLDKDQLLALYLNIAV